MNYRCVVEGKKLLKSSNVFLFRSSLPSPLSSLFVGELDESEKECMDLTCSHVQHLQFLLGEKKRGWRTGILNGYGGKCNPFESILQCAVREVKEEANVDLLPQNLRQIGVFRQTFDDKPELLLQVHVFTSTIWKGEIEESEEMKPVWTKTKDIDFSQMWADDPAWYPYMLHGVQFEGDLHFKNDQTMKWSNLSPVSEFSYN